MGVWDAVDLAYLDKYHKPMPENLTRELSGLSILQAAAYFRDVIGIQESDETMIADWNDLAMDQYRNHVEMKDGVLRFLNLLKDRGIKMAVGTSNTTTLAMTALNRHGLAGFFPVILTGEDIVKGKPDPFIYLEGARRLGVEPGQCLVFEDICAGVMAGKSAGMRVCTVYDTYSEYELDEKRAITDYYITSFMDLFENKVEVLNQ